MFALLGYQFSPKLRNLSSLKLSGMDGVSVPKAMKELISARANITRIEKQWPDIIRLIASVIVKRLNFDYIINMSYSLYFRRKVLAIKKNKGLSIRETAKYFCIGSATVSRWIRQIKPKPAVSRKRKIDKLALKKDVERYPDAYQKEPAVRFGVCQKAIWQALKKLSITYKKNIQPS